MTRVNIMGMQGDRMLLRPVLEKHYPQALEWPHNWSCEQVQEVLDALARGRKSKAKDAAIALLKNKQKH